MRDHLHTQLLRSFEKLNQNLCKFTLLLSTLWVGIHTGSASFNSTQVQVSEGLGFQSPVERRVHTY